MASRLRCEIVTISSGFPEKCYTAAIAKNHYVPHLLLFIYFSVFACVTSFQPVPRGVYYTVTMQWKEAVQVPRSHGKSKHFTSKPKRQEKGSNLSHLLHLLQKQPSFPHIPFLSHNTQLQMKLMVNIKAATSTA